MRIAVAEVAQETDSFSPLLADLADFEAYGLYEGDEILTRMRGVGPIGGFLETRASLSTLLGSTLLGNLAEQPPELVSYSLLSVSDTQ